MTEQPNGVNYPDVLGAITGGQRLNVDVVQCALAARPAKVAASQSFDLVLLLQNTTDVNVDIVIEPELPKQDLSKQKDRFATKTNRLLIGLRPAEAGVAVLPVAVAPNAKPGSGYLAALVLKVKRMERKWQRIRSIQGGGSFAVTELPQEAQDQMRTLHGLAFSTDSGGKKDHVRVPFVVMPPVALGGFKLQPQYIPLWTMGDFSDDYSLAQQVWQPAQAVVQRMKRDTIFMPLLKATQERFQACGYALLPPEAIYITKLLTLVAEMSIEAPSVSTPHPAWPRWFVRLIRILVKEPALAGQVEALAAQHLYTDLLYCAVLHGFAMITNVTGEDFGTAGEAEEYARDLVMAVEGRQPLDVARAYLPLVLAGLISNTRVTMPREQVRETVFILSKALEKRQAEQTEANAFVFEIANNLIERALDTA